MVSPHAEPLPVPVPPPDASHDPDDLARSLVELGRTAGAAAVGIAPPGPFPTVAAEMRRRVASGDAAGLRFTYRDPDVATDLRRTLPGARAVVVVAWPYLSGPRPDAPGRPVADPASPSDMAGALGAVARFAQGDGYAGLRAILARIAARLRDAGYRTEVLVDDERAVDRALAVAAGIGWWGRSTMVLVPGVGPWTLLGAVVTDAPLPHSSPMSRTCGGCVACIPACPTGAIVDAPDGGPGGVVDARRCISAVLQAPGAIDPALRAAIGARIYGCDDCLAACPPGVRHLDAHPGPPAPAPADLVALLGLADRPLLDAFPHLFVPRRRARYLRRNIVVALGNVATADEAQVVAGVAGHPDPLLRSHGAWAVGRLAERGVVSAGWAQAVLAQRLDREADPTVRSELVSSYATSDAVAHGDDLGPART